MKLITYFYTPTPQRRGTYGNIDPLAGTPGHARGVDHAGVGRLDDAREPARPVADAGAAGARREFARDFDGVALPAPPDRQAYGHLRPSL